MPLVHMRIVVMRLSSETIYRNQQSYHIIKKKDKQAGAELGQAQYKTG